MVNNTQNNKLDETVKQTLNNYEVEYNSADWSEMENLLNATPKSSNFKWSYSFTILIGVAILGGAYLLINNSSKTEKNNIIIPDRKIAEPKNNANTSTQPSSKNKTIYTPSVIENNKTVSFDNEKIDHPKEQIKKDESSVESKENKKELKKDVISKTKKPKNTDPIKIKDEDQNVHQTVIGMGNEPIFGDMLDSSKGLVGETKEKEELKKAAVKQSDSPIGWKNILSNKVNVDSIRKYRMQQQKDSLKANHNKQ